jgi:hypothetical protein
MRLEFQATWIASISKEMSLCRPTLDDLSQMNPLRTWLRPLRVSGLANLARMLRLVFRR